MIGNIYKDVSPFRLGIIQSRAARNIIAFRESVLDKYGLSAPEWFVIGYVNDHTKNGGVKVGDIASELEVQSTYATGIVRKLENKKLIQLRIGAQDRRVRMITATKEGSKLAKSINADFVGKSQDWLDGISDQAAANYVEVLGRIAQSRSDSK